MQAAAEAEMIAHFDAVDEATMAPGGALYFDHAESKQNPGGVLVKVCGIYRTVRPALDFASRFFLFPGKVKNVLKTFIGLMDGLCPDA